MSDVLCLQSVVPHGHVNEAACHKTNGAELGELGPLRIDWRWILDSEPVDALFWIGDSD